ncbi:S1 RNA-binding domain-containing protein 1-like [Limulus polyphemus]|uniref:S1 RNA-binding domain-containing protein 1-like n=1 Tax=Limulus polyphemus TaxID=6850 RepID=A0ABM1TH60_LIMPO|nr:S1 RNA-binding domain-containing protein 1-like [Limulus polyphemus]
MENTKQKPAKTLKQPFEKGKKSSQPAKKVKGRRVKKENEPACNSLKQMDNSESEMDIKILERQWEAKDAVAEATNIPTNVAQRVLDLFDQECTIPFIARYRKQITGGMEAEKLREVQQAYEEVKSVMKKSENVMKTLAKEQKLEPALKRSLCNAKTLAEIEHLYAPYKSGGQKTLAGRARVLGLEESALHILENFGSVKNILPGSFVKNDVKGLSTEQEVLTGWQHIMADAIAKNRDILDFVRKQCKSMDVTVTSTKSSTAEKLDKQAFVEGRDTSNYKFENYFNFKVSVQDIKSYQMLAINRGENQKVLTTKIVIPIRIKLATFELCRRKWGVLSRDKETADLIETSIQDAYSRLLEPHICREIRAELTKKAEKDSVDVFSTNLKRLLLIPPLRGRAILGIDPGFKHGCKLALISSTGDLLETNVIHPQRSAKESKTVLQKMLLTHRCETIALGNGTACRETEEFLSSLIQNRTFAPFDVMYCIVNESGVSIYSVTKDAEIEFPKLDPNLRSAVAIARRLQDPLLEYVKVEPKHLGF